MTSLSIANLVRNTSTIYVKFVLYWGRKSCTLILRSPPFYTSLIHRFVVSADRVSSDLEKIRAIEGLPKPKAICGVRSFHRLATFYHRFIKGFSTVMAPIIDFLKKGEFNWSYATTKAFVEIKKRMVSALIMRLSDFSKVFEVACDTSGIRIGGLLTQEGHPVAYFSEKLNDAQQWYSIYDTWWFRHFAIGDIIFYRMSLFSSLIMSPWSISTLKKSWKCDMGDRLNSFKTTCSLWATKRK